MSAKTESPRRQSSSTECCIVENCCIQRRHAFLSLRMLCQRRRIEIKWKPAPIHEPIYCTSQRTGCLWSHRSHMMRIVKRVRESNNAHAMLSVPGISWPRPARPWPKSPASPEARTSQTRSGRLAGGTVRQPIVLCFETDLGTCNATGPYVHAIMLTLQRFSSLALSLSHSLSLSHLSLACSTRHHLSHPVLSTIYPLDLSKLLTDKSRSSFRPAQFTTAGDATAQSARPPS